jgi:hypothetical protein
MLLCIAQLVNSAPLLLLLIPAGEPGVGMAQAS